MRKELIFGAHIPEMNKFERGALGATFVRDSDEKVRMLVMEVKEWRKEGRGWANQRVGDTEREPKQKAECQIVGCSCELKDLWGHAHFIPKSPATLTVSNAPSSDARCDRGSTCGGIAPDCVLYDAILGGICILEGRVRGSQVTTTWQVEAEISHQRIFVTPASPVAARLQSARSTSITLS